MLDADESMSLEMNEIVDAVKTSQKVINFLRDCGNRFLQELLEPTRLSTALAKLDTNQDGSIGIGRCPSLRMDTSKDGEVDIDEWEDAIQRGLAKRLEQLAEERERRERAARAEDEAFSAEFLNAAREVFLMIDVDNSGSLDKAEVVKAVRTDKKVINFLVNCGNQNLQYLLQMIDKDNSGTLTKTEIVKAVAEDKDVVKFLRTCGEDNLQFLLQPARLEKALQVLDTSKDGEVDIDEWEEAVHRGLAKRLEQLAEERERRDRAARADDEAFTAQFLNAAREVFLMIDVDNSGSLDKAEVVALAEN